MTDWVRVSAAADTFASEERTALMTSKIGNIVFIEAQDYDVCELCGKVEELRPYGPNGENVCFDCGMKDEAAAKKAFGKLINGDVQ